ncbi:unnamed protein product [Rotaria magnacalcarata]|uniref:Uncharacterized protein n=1 Tax=Rotaria magnacalcarata TaxID=392030 RepID=A0A816DVM6_9BILA|nr:unnamed protein product [Rotaria magnacalcarata]CAF2246689.1 unnamed protein product [Rotaria magnacalcarata]CAF4006717.1 unnamed protein product [Rotaria magnacalcarata]CAF4015342.1 unnamed protein product [Rotaria magnacalcarata]
MATTITFTRDKRSQNPRKIFSPSTPSTPLPSHYLIYMEDTLSYSIVGRTSIKKIQGKMATLIINKKKLIGEIVIAGNYLALYFLGKIFIIIEGTFTRCQAELSKVQKASQSIGHNDTTDNEEDELENYEFNENNDIIENDQADDNIETYSHEDLGTEELDDEILYNIDINRKRKFQSSYPSINASRSAKRLKHTTVYEIDPESNNENDTSLFSTTKEQGITTTADAALKSIENKMNDFSKHMLKMSQAIRQIASCSNQSGSQNLDGYRDPNSQESFTSKVDHNGINLVTVAGKDFGDFARQVMRILYTPDELKTCVLPPGRSYLSRKPLDPI